MTTSFRFGIDWNRKGLVCWDARPGDPLNILPTPLTYSAIDYRLDEATSIELEVLKTPYGFWAFTVQTGADTDNGLILGRDNDSPTFTADDIPVDPSMTYSAAVWVRGVIGYGGVDFRFRAKDQDGTVVATSYAFNLTADWQRVVISGTTDGSASHLYLELVKDNEAADVTFQATGFMLVEGSTMPNGYNAGHPSNLHDNVTEVVISANWFLGMRQPYADVAHDSVLNLVLNNSDQRFSPEFGSSPLNSTLVPFRPVGIESNDGATQRTHFVGWLESVQPAVNQYGQRTVQMTAAGPMLFFNSQETNVELQENKRTDEIIEALVKEIQMPPALTRAWILGDPIYGRLGRSTYLPNLTIDHSLQQGQTTLAYAADNWVRQSENSNMDTFDVYRAIKDTVAAERGRFFFNREGQATFWNRHHLLVPPADPPEFNDSMTDLEYTFAGLDEFKNEVIVTCHPREISVTDDELLWKLDKPLTLPRKQTRKVTASFHDDSDNRIGGRNVRLENITISKGTPKITFEVSANRAVIEINSRKSETVIDTLEVRGQKITDFGRMEATARNNHSIAYYGRRTMPMNLPAVDDFEFAQSIAAFEKGRRSEPQGKVKAITLKSHGMLGGGTHNQQLDLTIGDLIRVQETQTDHDHNYYIIGEAQRLSESGALLETTWYLESASAGNWWILGRSRLGQTAHLAY